MAPWVDIPLATQEGQERSSYASDCELQNLIVRPLPPRSRSPFAITSDPAVSFQNSALGGSIRGACVHDGALWFVSGTTVYHYTPGGSTTAVAVGSMPSSGLVRMASAGTHVVMVDGTNARAATTAEVFACSRGNFSDVTYQDGYTIYAETGSQSVYVSDLDDPTTIGALNFTTADAQPGDVRGVFSLNRELVVFKETTTEFYYNDGSAGFPFSRSNPGLIEIGLGRTNGSSPGPRSFAQFGDRLYWIGQDKKAYFLAGYRPNRISTPWVEKLLAEETLFYGSAYTMDGRAYYMVTLQDRTGHLLYDIEAGIWSAGQIPSLSGASTIESSRLQGFSVDSPDAYCTVKQDVDAWIAKLDPTVFQDGKQGGSPAPTNVTRTLTLPAVSYGGQRAFMSELYLDMEKATTGGTLSLQWSDDGGVTYTSAKAGTATNERVRWSRLGSFRQRILRFTFEINNRVAIMGCRARIEVGE
jgi:hypothetical protein